LRPAPQASASNKTGAKGGQDQQVIKNAQAEKTEARFLCTMKALRSAENFRLATLAGRLAQSAPFLSVEVKQGEISHETKTAFTTDKCE
jgi:hypothetical protein